MKVKLREKLQYTFNVNEIFMLLSGSFEKNLVNVFIKVYRMNIYQKAMNHVNKSI